MTTSGLSFNVDVQGALYRDILHYALRNGYDFSFVIRDDVTYRRDLQSVMAQYALTSVNISRISEWPGTRLLRSEATLLRNKLSDTTTDLLARADGLFCWMAPDRPEDLALYDGDRVVIFGTSHEETGWIDASAFPHSVLKRVEQLSES